MAQQVYAVSLFCPPIPKRTVNISKKRGTVSAQDEHNASISSKIEDGTSAEVVSCPSDCKYTSYNSNVKIIYFKFDIM